ncbi:hypothetical protein MTP03_09460 [Tsukamurella sp. PLM1]|nr:hypothetical protein MTP03_09460 [Tsukamurella sp. PLM1]
MRRGRSPGHLPARAVGRHHRLALSGLPVERFQFDGFAPRKSGARRAWLAELVTERRACVFFESPHRLAETLADARDVLGRTVGPRCVAS